MFTIVPSTVVDNGSFSIKHGDSTLSSPLHSNVSTSPTGPSLIENGVIRNFDDLIDFYIQSLGEGCETLPIVIAEHLHWRKHPLRSGLLQALFDRGFQVAALVSQIQLALLGTGVTTGIVLDIGHVSSQMGAVFEGYLLRNSDTVATLSGLELNYHLSTEIQNITANMGLYRGRCIDTFYDEIKRASSETTGDRRYQLPDGTFINLQFLDHIAGVSSQPEKNPIAEWVRKTAEDFVDFPELQRTVLVAGGGANSRVVTRAVRALLSPKPGLLTGKVFLDPTVRPHSTPDWISEEQTVKRLPEDAAWHGGALVSALPSCAAFWITKSEFEEKGENFEVYDGSSRFS